jgi:hypothetical protein
MHVLGPCCIDGPFREAHVEVGLLLSVSRSPQPTSSTIQLTLVPSLPVLLKQTFGLRGQQDCEWCLLFHYLENVGVIGWVTTGRQQLQILWLVG